MTHLDWMSLLLAGEHDEATRQLPEYAKAKAWMEEDDENRAWFEAERDFFAKQDGLLSAACLSELSRVRIQEAVEKELGRATTDGSSAYSSATTTSTTSASSSSSSRRGWLSLVAALAAIALVGLGISMFSGGDEAREIAKPEGQVQEFEHFAATRIAEFDFKIMNESKTTASTQEWLDSQEALNPDAITGVSIPTLGCTLLDWNGNQVAVVCMKPNTGPVVHLFAVDRSAIPESEWGNFGDRMWRDRATKSWLDDEIAYVLVNDRKGADLTVPEELELKVSGA